MPLPASMVTPSDPEPRVNTAGITPQQQGGPYIVPAYADDSGAKQGMAVDTCVLVGFGSVAHLHLAKAQAAGIRVLAVVETDPEKCARVAATGLLALADLDEAVPLRPGYWDICVPTAAHLPVLAAILARVPAANILLEKPLCLPSETTAMRALIARSGARLVVNEQYAGSPITAMVRRAVTYHGVLRAERVIVEMSKSRLLDLAAGRFLDTELGVLGYEGTHLLALLEDLHPACWPSHLEQVRFEDAYLPGGRCLVGQGLAAVEARGTSGVSLLLHSALAGGIGHPLPPHAPAHIAPSDGTTRYRVLAAECRGHRGERWTVAGFYEPIAGLPRCVGMVNLLRESREVLSIPVNDDPLARHLRRALLYFASRGTNPYTADRALAAVEALAAMARLGWEERVAEMVA